MLLWPTLHCLLYAIVVVSQITPPGLLADHDQDTTLRPLKDQLESMYVSDSARLIRGLFVARQSGCSDGFVECTEYPGRSVLQLLSPCFLSRFRAPLCTRSRRVHLDVLPPKHERSWYSIWKKYHTGVIRRAVPAAQPAVVSKFQYDLLDSGPSDPSEIETCGPGQECCELDGCCDPGYVSENNV